MIIHTSCRMCGSTKLHKVMDLGDQPLANAFLAKEQLAQPEATYPLVVYWCEECSLAQLIHTVDPSILFRDYVYFSMGMPKVSDHFRRYAEDALSRFVTDPSQLVVEVGSNDGVLLLSIKDRVRVLGVDPALNIAKLANERGVETLAEFFSESLAKQIKESHGSARIIIGNNVIAHIDDHTDLVRGVRELLDPDGVFVFEAPYLTDMFDNLAFDTVYHEHLNFFAVRPLVQHFASKGLEVFDVELHPVQGLSLRVFVGHPGKHPVSSRVQERVSDELKRGFDKRSTYEELAQKVAHIKDEVVIHLQNLKKSGKKIAGYGAPAKGNTLLNYYGIGPETLDYLTEALPSKIGKFSPGMRIPVIDIDEARKNPPDYFFMLAWNYQKAILEKETEFRTKGGKFVMPIGTVREL
ncbi:MAG: class I SAM-dependent methyltransferase [Candidatus Pacebacteria bacterium]|nr:class I SAM-dependent methyltransferase [Candidatus Paceibacterota bacterium]